jgi:hypothetical protein
MSLNSKQRSRWIADIISDLQRCLSKLKDHPEAPLIQKALHHLDDAKRLANEDHSE